MQTIQKAKMRIVMKLETTSSAREKKREKKKERMISAWKGANFTIPRLISIKIPMENTFSAMRTHINKKGRTQ